MDETKTWDVKSDVALRRASHRRPRERRGPAQGTAMIADPRNDQTLIILQLHVAMDKFHNRLVDYMRAAGIPRAAVFESARRLARWHYQWIVTHEFLPAIVGTTTANSVYKETSKAPIINLKFYKPTNLDGTPLHPGRVRGGGIPLRPHHHAAPLHGAGPSLTAPATFWALSPACRCSAIRPPTTS